MSTKIICYSNAELLF